MTSQSLQLSERLRWISLGSQVQEPDPGNEVLQGLAQTPKTLPCRYFYDDYGSSLFEQITTLPEYYLTRTEQGILENYAQAIAQWTGPCDLIELGSGSSTKTRLLLTAYDAIDPTLKYCPVDVSAGILKETALCLLEQYPRLSVVGLAGTYENAMQHLPESQDKPRMILFLGSTLGNMSGAVSEKRPSEQAQFFGQVNQSLSPGDFFLLGVDLQKPIPLIEAAYNDAQGITAEFNLNILTHLNRLFLGDFVRSQYKHVAQYNADLHQMELSLRSCVAQSAYLEALDCRVVLEPSELIQTEISRKFDLDQLSAALTQSGLPPVQVWMDPKQWFAVILCQRPDAS